MSNNIINPSAKGKAILYFFIFLILFITLVVKIYYFNFAFIK